MSPEAVVGVDLGGTFVDVALDVGGVRHGFKVSGGERPALSFFGGIDEIFRRELVAAQGIARIIHGTTLTTNALLERKLARTTQIATCGFRDVLEIGRHSAPRSGNIQRWVKPQRPITRNHIIEVPERTAADGEVLLAPGAEELERLREAVRPYDAIAVSLINSVANSSNEDVIADFLQDAFPEKMISRSSEVRRVAGEYERTMTTLLNAALQPVLSTYLDEISDGLRQRGIDAPLYLMGSDGGLITVDEAKRFPINTVMSGPAGGVQAASIGARVNGQDRLVTLDVGGTSSDIARTEDGAVGLVDNAEIGDYLMNVPIVEIATIGAGGGSIASVHGGRLVVGPESAGSNPGPACYSRGGTEPTVTDAMLVLGWLPDALAGGSLELNAERARKVVKERIAKPLGMSVETAALGIVRIANERIASALRRISLDRGHDPRDYALMPFGGGGGLHAVDVARSATLSHVLIPPQPGTFSAQGLLDAPLTKHLVAPLPSLPALTAATIAEYRELQRRFERELGDWSEQDSGIVETIVLHQLEVQYQQQGSPLKVRVPESLDDAQTAALIRERFEDQHEERYSYRLPDREIVISAAHAQGVAHLERIVHAAHLQDGGGYVPPEASASRRVFTEQDEWIDCRVVGRTALLPGAPVRGPIIVEETTTTLYVPSDASIEAMHNDYLKVTW